jgi:hypothetical protein
MPPLVLHTALEPQGVGLQGSISSTTAAAAKRHGVQRGYSIFFYLLQKRREKEKRKNEIHFFPEFGTVPYKILTLFAWINRSRNDPHEAMKKLRKSCSKQKANCFPSRKEGPVLLGKCNRRFKTYCETLPHIFTKNTIFVFLFL